MMVFGILAGCSQKWGIEQITTELKAIAEKDEPDAIFDVYYREDTDIIIVQSWIDGLSEAVYVAAEDADLRMSYVKLCDRACKKSVEYFEWAEEHGFEGDGVMVALMDVKMMVKFFWQFIMVKRFKAV